MPEDRDFDVTSLPQLKEIVRRFQSRGITPVVVEPLPNILHDHIKLGDSLRDESIEKFIQLMANLREVGISMVCFNFMAHYGWTRTDTELPERGGARVTGFRLDKFSPDNYSINSDKLWKNYEYFIHAVVPEAERYGIKLALHPDDPPLEHLGGVSRIFTSLEAIKRGISIVDSSNLGVTFCQACFQLMNEQLEEVIPALAEKILFIHFRNIRGCRTDFSETFHDNGDIDMPGVMRLYLENGVDAPIRVDHVPTLEGEQSQCAGYDVLGRQFA
ncbi:MAG: mannonate dehydratase, partial [Eubacteriales bacterium]